MIKIEDIKRLGLLITWKLLYKGICERQLGEEDVIMYAIEKLEEGDTRKEICELAGTYVDERKEICNLLDELAEQENAPDDFEGRKIRAAIVSKALRVKNDDYINGLLDLTDLWIDLGCPNDSPHIIQGRENDITPMEYYTIANYNFLYEKNIEWLKRELEYLRENQ